MVCILVPLKISFGIQGRQGSASFSGPPTPLQIFLRAPHHCSRSDCHTQLACCHIPREGLGLFCAEALSVPAGPAQLHLEVWGFSQGYLYLKECQRRRMTGQLGRDGVVHLL